MRHSLWDLRGLKIPTECNVKPHNTDRSTEELKQMKKKGGEMLKTEVW